MKCVKIVALVLPLIALVACADSPVLDENRHALLAVTITDFEDSGWGDHHATWYVYEAEVEKVIAGQFEERAIRFALLQTFDTRPVFPAQYILVDDFGDSELADAFDTKIHALSMIKAEETACFVIDPAELFPENPRFNEIAQCPKEYCFSLTCYESKKLLASNSE